MAIDLLETYKFDPLLRKQNKTKIIFLNQVKGGAPSSATSPIPAGSPLQKKLEAHFELQFLNLSKPTEVLTELSKIPLAVTSYKYCQEIRNL